MNTVGFQDLPPQAIEALRQAPKITVAASYSRGEEGRFYVRVDRSSIERAELIILIACPLLARIMAGSAFILIFDPDEASVAERSRRRAEMLRELAEDAPEVAAGIISQEMKSAG